MPPLLPSPSRALSSLLLLKPSNSFPSSSAMSAAVTTSSSSAPSKPRLRGVVFDMDGTLTVPVIDFQAMYKAVLGNDEYVSVKSKCPAGIDILRHIENWSLDKQHKAYQIIADYERQGLDRLQIMPGASELCGFLDSRNIRRGLITRNVKESVDLFHQRFGGNAPSKMVDGPRWEGLRKLTGHMLAKGPTVVGIHKIGPSQAGDRDARRLKMFFSPAVSREFRPYKPDPAALLHICATWQVEAHEVMMIGDSLKDDVACGKRAGAYTCLLDETGRYDAPEYANVEFKPDYKVTSLAEVYSLLEANFDLTP